jgi:hypothetical protein
MGYFEHVGALYLLITGQLIGGENGRFEACLRYTGDNQEKYSIIFTMRNNILQGTNPAEYASKHGPMPPRPVPFKQSSRG